MGQQEQLLNRQVIQPIADIAQRGRNMEGHQIYQKQMYVSWERPLPFPNINAQIGEKPKEHFSRLEEKLSKDLVQFHRIAWDQEENDLDNQKSRLSDIPPAGYAEGNVQIRPFIEAYNRGHRFYIHEYQAFWKEDCYKLIKRKPQQSDMRKDSPRSPGRYHDKDKNEGNNRRNGKTSLILMEQQFVKGMNSQSNWIQPREDIFLVSEQQIRDPSSTEQQSSGNKNLSAKIITIDLRIEPKKELLTS
ncbi:MAG: hypothetical protein EZS28_008708 [Streblomastix strix]|uniref:Uncharacterized protein n=1 Tax=Streblomastix strix TaxID=222440 RepID=A0A5J4WMH7_9EUKA|nr:MAG: hypothetical protein EZS28_008708 [Streblomastix strix]